MAARSEEGSGPVPGTPAAAGDKKVDGVLGAERRAVPVQPGPGRPGSNVHGEAKPARSQADLERILLMNWEARCLHFRQVHQAAFFDPVADTPLEDEYESEMDAVGALPYLMQMIANLNMQPPRGKITETEARRVCRKVIRAAPDYQGEKFQH